MKYKITSLILSILTLVSVPSLAEKNFKDVDENAWYIDSVNSLEKLGIIKGFKDNTLRPDNYSTREEMTAVICRLYDIIEHNLTIPHKEIEFKDRDEITWSKQYIRIMYVLDIIKGYEDGTFRPKNKITREEAAVIINRLLKSKNVNLSKSDIRFEDDSKISDWAKDDIYKLKSKDYIKGYKNNFKPKEYITRAEIFQIIHNILTENLSSNEEIYPEYSERELFEISNLVVKGKIESISDPFLVFSESGSPYMFKDVIFHVNEQFKGEKNDKIKIRIPINQFDFENYSIYISTATIEDLNKLNDSIIFLFKQDNSDNYTLLGNLSVKEDNKEIRNVLKEVSKK